MQFIIHIYCVHLHKVNITARLRMSEPLEQARDFFQLERNEKEKISRTTKKNVWLNKQTNKTTKNSTRTHIIRHHVHIVVRERAKCVFGSNTFYDHTYKYSEIARSLSLSYLIWPSQFHFTSSYCYRCVCVFALCHLQCTYTFRYMGDHRQFCCCCFECISTSAQRSSRNPTMTMMMMMRRTAKRKSKQERKNE